MFEQLCNNLRCRLLLYMVPALLLLGGMVYLAFHFIANDAVERLAHSFAEDKVRFHKQQATGIIEQEVNLSKLLANTPTLIAWALHENDHTAKAQAIALLERYREVFRDKSYFFVIDQSNHYYFNDRKNSYVGKELRYTLSQNMHRDAWYYATRKRKKQCQINIDYDEVLKSNKVWINCLLRHQGNIVGIVGTGIDLTDFIHTVVNTHQPGVSNMYINQQGAIQMAPNVKNIDFNSLTHTSSHKTIFNYFDTDAVRNRFVAMLEQIKRSPQNIGVMDVTIHGRPHIIGLSSMPEIGWINVTILDLHQFALRRYFLSFGLLIGLGMVLLLVLLVLFLNRIVLAPIHRMERNIEKMKLGHYSISSDDITPDEIGRLTKGFFGMATAVKNHATELKQRVNERTAKLEATTQELQHAKESAEQANLAKTRFLSAASHDLRQPLQALRLFNEALARYPQDQTQAKLFDNIKKCQCIIQSMLDGVLDISKLDAGMLQPRIEIIAVGEMFERLQSIYAAQADAKDIALFAHCCPDACIHSDLVMIESILSNLLGNAIDHAACETILLTCRRRGDRWRIEIRDNGSGIAAADQHAIFEEFYQLRNVERDREKGLGLGLAIVKRLCALLGHALELRSTPGRGSTFAITIPSAPFPAKSDEIKGDGIEESRISFQHGLLIDDDALVRESLLSCMHSQECTVHIVANRREAEQLVVQQCPDFILCDYRLPKDCGIALIRHLWRCIGHPVPTVLLTGDTAGSVLEDAAQADILVMHKPVDTAELFAALRTQHVTMRNITILKDRPHDDNSPS